MIFKHGLGFFTKNWADAPVMRIKCHSLPSRTVGGRGEGVFRLRCPGEVLKELEQES